MNKEHEPLFSPRCNPCINHRTGCGGTVTKRGTVLCDKCAEERKSASKRKDVEFDELLLKCKKLEEDLETTRKKCNDLPEPKISYDVKYYEKEIENLNEQNSRLKKENETLIADKSRYEILYSQAKIDIEQLQFEKEMLEREIVSEN